MNDRDKSERSETKTPEESSHDCRGQTHVGFAWLSHSDTPEKEASRIETTVPPASLLVPDVGRASVLRASGLASRRTDPAVQSLINRSLVGLLCIVGLLVTIEGARAFTSPHLSGPPVGVTGAVPGAANIPTTRPASAVTPDTLPHRKPVSLAPVAASTRGPAAGRVVSPRSATPSTPLPQTSRPRQEQRVTPTTLALRRSTSPQTTLGQGVAVPFSPATTPPGQSGAVAVPVGPGH